MKTPHPLYNGRLTVYTCELETCALCGAGLVAWGYQSSPMTVFTLTGVRNVAQRPKRCPNAGCAWHTALLKSATWQHLAPRYGVYGYDVVAAIGWVRQEQRQPFAEIHADLAERLPISEAEVRYRILSIFRGLTCCGRSPDRATTGTVGDPMALTFVVRSGRSPDRARFRMLKRPILAAPRQAGGGSVRRPATAYEES